MPAHSVTARRRRYLQQLTMTALLAGLLVLHGADGGGAGGTSRPAPETGADAQEEPVHCNVAQQNCVMRIGCGMALHNYLVFCGQVMHGQTDVCPARCRKALVSLLSTEDRQGEAFMECNCNDNTYCHTQKKRIEMCSRDVLDAMKRLNDDDTHISCSLAELICRADSSCLAALNFFDMNCAKLQTGEKCTARCNNSLGILLRQKKARKLRTCVCDGTETYQCQTVQDSIERLCHHRSRSRHHHNHTRPERPTTHRTTPTGGAVEPLSGQGQGQQSGASSCSNTSSDVGAHCVPTSAAVTSFRIPLSLRTTHGLTRMLAAVLLAHFLYWQR